MKYRSKRIRIQLYEAYNLFIDNLLKEQNNSCAICNRPFNENKYVIDHCYTTKEIRGLLCLSCNNLVGQIENMRFGKKSLALLAKIGDYLYKHSL
jgi:hypothetical protein